jgi:hypothetical protein
LGFNRTAKESNQQFPLNFIGLKAAVISGAGNQNLEKETEFRLFSKLEKFQN